ncbi:MAG: TfoX/Sxy family DNA transformation protein [Steroidobacteraceae bacterium]
MPRTDQPSQDLELAELRNLGPKSAAMLASVGITTLAELRKRGAVAAYVAVKRERSGASLNLLYALVGMLEDCDWKTVQRERKLELMLAVEDCERANPAGIVKPAKKTDELSQLRNIGRAMRADFDLLDIGSVEQLARCDADELYARIQTLTHTRHDPCVWDTYAAAIHQARTGEALPWWGFTQIRKHRQAQGTFVKPARTTMRKIVRQSDR